MCSNLTASKIILVFRRNEFAMVAVHIIGQVLFKINASSLHSDDPGEIAYPSAKANEMLGSLTYADERIQDFPHEELAG